MSGCVSAVVQALRSLLRSDGRETLGSEVAEDKREQEGLLIATLEVHCVTSCFCCVFFSARIFVMLTWELSDLFVKTGTSLGLCVAGWVLLSKGQLAETDEEEENDGREVKDDGNRHVSAPW